MQGASDTTGDAGPGRHRRRDQSADRHDQGGGQHAVRGSLRVLRLGHQHPAVPDRRQRRLRGQHRGGASARSAPACDRPQSARIERDRRLDHAACWPRCARSSLTSTPATPTRWGTPTWPRSAPREDTISNARAAIGSTENRLDTARCPAAAARAGVDGIAVGHRGHRYGPGTGRLLDRSRRCTSRRCVRALR